MFPTDVACHMLPGTWGLCSSAPFSDSASDLGGQAHLGKHLWPRMLPTGCEEGSSLICGSVCTQYRYSEKLTAGLIERFCFVFFFNKNVL